MPTCLFSCFHMFRFGVLVIVCLAVLRSPVWVLQSFALASNMSTCFSHMFRFGGLVIFCLAVLRSPVWVFQVSLWHQCFHLFVLMFPHVSFWRSCDRLSDGLAITSLDFTIFRFVHMFVLMFPHVSFWCSCDRLSDGLAITCLNFTSFRFGLNFSTFLFSCFVLAVL